MQKGALHATHEVNCSGWHKHPIHVRYRTRLCGKTIIAAPCGYAKHDACTAFIPSGIRFIDRRQHSGTFRKHSMSSAACGSSRHTANAGGLSFCFRATAISAESFFRDEATV